MIGSLKRKQFLQHLKLRSYIQVEVREFLKLAIPLASAQVAQSATGFADTVMMGRMGADVLAAGGLASIIFWSLSTASSGVVMGISPLIAEAFGASQKTRIQKLARQGLWLAFFVSIPMIILIGQLERWMILAGQAEATVKLVSSYLDIMLWGLFPTVGFVALRATVSALSQAQPVMFIVVLGTAFNIIGNYILGFGKLGFPQMGLTGLALASTLALWSMFVALALYVLLHRKLKSYRILQGLHRIRPKVLKELLWIGLPIGIFSGLEMGFFMAIMFLMGTLGTEALAAHQIVFQTIVVTFMVPLGMSHAATVRVGQWLGRQDFMSMRKAVWISIGICTIFMLGTSVTFLLFPKQIIGIYLDLQNPENAAVVSLALPLLTIAAISQVLDGIQKAVYGSLQGLQDTQIPMMLNVVGYWVIGLSTGYALGFYLGWGSVGLWIGQAVAITVVAGSFIWRLCELMRQREVCNATQALQQG